MVHLIRHGEVYNPKHLVYADLPGFGLSESGRLQAKEAGRYLASSPVVAVWSSPLERAIETAHLIASRHRLRVRVDAELTEWHLSGRWAGVGGAADSNARRAGGISRTSVGFELHT